MEDRLQMQYFNLRFKYRKLHFTPNFLNEIGLQNVLGTVMKLTSLLRY